MKDGRSDKAVIATLRVAITVAYEEMRELEQENMDKEDENARLLQQLLVAREDGMEIAEHNAVLRKKLTEKHDDNARLQRQLAVAHKEYARDLETKKRAEEFEASDTTLRMSNAERVNDDLHAQLERLNSMVATLWEERGIGVQPHMKMEMDDNPDYVFREVDDTGGTGLVYKIESDGEAVRFTATNGTYNDFIELPLDITYDLLIGLKVGSGGQYRF
jgi:predicted RNase H-like nuclease (RuvC/YqgF family)